MNTDSLQRPRLVETFCCMFDQSFLHPFDGKYRGVTVLVLLYSNVGKTLNTNPNLKKNREQILYKSERWIIETLLTGRNFSPNVSKDNSYFWF